jgi:hypothetical protein
MRKLLDTAAVVSLLISGTLAAGSIYGYLYFSTPANQEKLQKVLIDKVKGALIPSVGGGLSKSLPGAACGWGSLEGLVSPGKVKLF